MTDRPGDGVVCCVVKPKSEDIRIVSIPDLKKKRFLWQHSNKEGISHGGREEYLF